MQGGGTGDGKRGVLIDTRRAEEKVREIFRR